VFAAKGMNSLLDRLSGRGPFHSMIAEAVGSPFDYPLSSRMDENDAILVFDRALAPWENVLI
jgi:4-hydroxyphenylacetate 3-monooxygenase